MKLTAGCLSSHERHARMSAKDLWNRRRADVDQAEAPEYLPFRYPNSDL
jgi:hypothetical protein